jgi:hypothetical protein
MNTVTLTDDETVRLVKILETIRDLNIDESTRLQSFIEKNHKHLSLAQKRTEKSKMQRHTDASMNAIRILNKIWQRPSPASVFGGEKCETN